MLIQKIIIIGGGITGLASAYSIEKEAEKKGKHVSITLLEKNSRIGGNIITERDGDFLIEGGPDCFLSEKPWALKMCEKLGMNDSLLCTNDEYRKTFILWKGHLHELPEGVILMIPTKMLPLVRSNLISLPGKLRMAMEPFIPKKKSDKDESLSEFVRRRLGREVLDKIAAPLVAGVHAEDPDTMSVKSRFPRFVQMEEEYGSLIRGMIARRKINSDPSAGSGRTTNHAPHAYKNTMFMTLKNGLYDLPDTIVKNLKETKIWTNKEVSKIDESVSEGGGNVYKVSLKNGEVLDADAVILAAPSYETAKLLSELNSSISDILNQIPYVSTATVSLCYKKDTIFHPMNGFGFLVPKPENRKITGATWVSRKFSYRAPDDSILIRCFLGGSHNEALVSLNDRDMIKMVREELRDIMGISAEPMLIRIYRWEKAMPQYVIGHEKRLSILDERLSKYHGIFVTGSAYRGSGISECIKDAQFTAERVFNRIMS